MATPATMAQAESAAVAVAERSAVRATKPACDRTACASVRYSAVAAAAAAASVDDDDAAAAAAAAAAARQAAARRHAVTQRAISLIGK